MTLANKIQPLIDLGIIDWIAAGESDDQVVILINSLANYLFEEVSVKELAPSDDPGWIQEHFLESGYDLQWFEFITNRFAESIEIEASNIAANIPNSSYLMTDGELEIAIVEWVREWCGNCRIAFRQKLEFYS